MNTSIHHPGLPATLQRALLGVALLVVFLVPIAVSSPSVVAATTPTSRVRLVDITDARVGRGVGAGAVTATAVNSGLAVATNVSVRYHLPTGVEFVAARSSAGCVVNGPEVECALGDLAPGRSTPVAIGVGEPSATAVLGSRTGYFLPPTTDEYDPEAGELLLDTWYHEAGLEGTDLALCWPVANPSPNMDVAGGVCDGTSDSPALTPDETAVLDAFPAPYSESLVRSWQFETEITVPESGSYRACGTMIDDGGYVAIAPADRAVTDGDVVVSVLSYDSATSAPIELDAGTRYRVLMRVSNRGFEGVDNGADNNTLAGWEAYGFAPADQPCDADAARSFGTSDTAFVDRTVADVVVVGTSDLLVAGAIEGAPVEGSRHASVRVVNDGSDTSGARVTLGMSGGASLAGPFTGCDRMLTSPAPTCELDAIRGRTAPSRQGRVFSFSFISPTPGVTWTVDASTAIDVDPSNNHGPVAAAVTSNSPGPRH